MIECFMMGSKLCLIIKVCLADLYFLWGLLPLMLFTHPLIKQPKRKQGLELSLS